MIRVDVLAKQREFEGTPFDQLTRFGEDGGNRPRILDAARIGHDAEGAELVAAFLDERKAEPARMPCGDGR